MPRHVAAAVLSAVALAVAAVPAAAADPTLETAASGAVSATFAATDAGDGRWIDVKLTVVRDGVVAFDAAPVVADCVAPYCAPATGFEARPSLQVVDVDGDGEPEVLVDLYSGGAHCCVVTAILRWTGQGYVTVARNFADFGYTLQPAAAPGAAATFVTGDARFAYAFASFADSAFPVRLLELRAGTWRDVTRAHPESLRADAARWLKAYRERRLGLRSLGVLAAYVADEYRLGHRAAADRLLAHELRAGRLRGDRYWPRRKAYITTLQRRLRVWGYA